MELPFAVDYASSEMAAAAPSPWTVRNPERTSATVTAEDDDSLVAASSQGSSFCASASEDMDPPVPRRVTASVVPATAPHRSAAAPPLPATDEGLASVLSQYGVVEPEAGVDAEFTYVNVGDAAEDDDDECRILTSQDLADGPELAPWRRYNRQDVLALLLTDTGCEGDVDIEALVRTTEQAQSAVLQACNAKKEGNLPKALEEHAAAASLYRTAARSVQTKNASLAYSFALLSKAHARSALALQRILQVASTSTAHTIQSQLRSKNAPTVDTQTERLRATVRGALNQSPQADISNSTFLGRGMDDKTSKEHPSTTKTLEEPTTKCNPVDEIMLLEKELQSMDMALSLGNSIASLDVRTQNRWINSMVDGSFMVVQPAGSAAQANSFLSSPKSNVQSGTGIANVRARANRVQTILDSSNTGHRPSIAQAQGKPGQQVQTGASHGLESSWWGSNASHMLASSIMSVTNSGGRNSNYDPAGSANSKQLLRLMDSLKVLGDENAALLKEVQGAETARMEAKAAREQMRRFKEEYTKKFEALKEALDRFQKSYPSGQSNLSNPVCESEFVKNATGSEQLQRQETLIKKLTLELKKEKEDNQKKDAALRKYETFYREVKARSAQKAAQRQRETAHRQQNLTKSVQRPSTN